MCSANSSTKKGNTSVKQSFFLHVAHLPRWGHRLALTVALLAVVLVFSVFSFAPAAYAAPVHFEKQAGVSLSSPGMTAPLSVTLQKEQVVPSACSYHISYQHSYSGYTLRLWVYTCNGGVHAELLAQSTATFWVDLALKVGGQCQSIEEDVSYLTPGNGLNTHTYYGSGNTWCVFGGYVV
jgi:hypothetical protein